MKRDVRKIQVIGLGQASLDYLGRIPSYPQEDRKVELMDLYMQCGGPASTALVTLSRLGVSTSFLGSISDDPFGREILKGLKEESVDTTFLKITPGYISQFAFIAITESTASIEFSHFHDFFFGSYEGKQLVQMVLLWILRFLHCSGIRRNSHDFLFLCWQVFEYLDRILITF